MYYRPSGGPVMGRELITAREHDVFGFIQAKGLKPASLIRLDRETGADLLPFADLERVMHSGISSAEITAPYEAMTLEALRADRGRLVAAAAKSGVPGSVFNDLAYESLGRKDLARALEFATLQSLVAPSSANGWDTLGEVYYLLGDAEAARTYDAAAKKLGLATAGESVWKEDQADFEKRWSLPSAKGR